jgi:hypothetical protein
MQLFFLDKKAERSRGFTLLLAALVASIVLALGSSIYTIARKQVTLSSLGRDSQFAFYAADTIVECALYYDIRFSLFATSSESGPMQDVTCDGVTVTPTLESVTEDTAVSRVTMTIFTLDEDGAPMPTNSRCADVTIYKNNVAPFTVLHADGYSTSCETISSSARALQRSIEIQY